eukprot:Amastigsp_a176881_27.p2 type:complete len:134 gc:universal Amastigsp_a176881_27:495-94(-)
MATGSFACLGSQTLTVPSRDAVTISGAPPPIPRPPQPSIALTIALWPATLYTGSSGRSRSQIHIRPEKSPVARNRSSVLEAANVPHLNGCCFSTSESNSALPLLSPYTQMQPVPRACEPRATKRADRGTHFVS